jgi:non-ribosomal peptide synthetase-like protein
VDSQFFDELGMSSLLIGRWKPREINVWSLAYLRFWLVKTLIHANPLALFAGSPVYSLYLRALGARVGRRVVILSRAVPVCTDMLTIGDDTVIRKESSFAGYRGRSRDHPDRAGQHRPGGADRRAHRARHGHLGGARVPARTHVVPV